MNPNRPQNVKVRSKQKHQEYIWLMVNVPFAIEVSSN